MKYALFVIIAGAAFLISVLLSAPFGTVLSLFNLVLTILLAELLGRVVNILRATKVTRSRDGT